MNGSFGPFLVIGAGLALGFFLRRGRYLPENSRKVLNAYVIAIAVPALVLAHLPTYLRDLFAAKTPLPPGFWFLPVIPWLIAGTAIPFFAASYRRGWIRRDQWGLLVLSAGLGNTAFVGFPLIEALLGPENLPAAILLDQLGTFLALSVGGTAWIAYFRATMSDEGRRATEFSPAVFFRELMRFPPFVALIAAFVASAFAPFPGVIQSGFERFASTLVPVAMVSVGTQLTLNRAAWHRESGGVVWGLGYKMILAPLVIALIGKYVVGLEGNPLSVAMLESAMAPMITSTVLGMEAGFAPDLGALMLGIGIPLSLATVPLIHFLFG